MPPLEGCDLIFDATQYLSICRYLSYLQFLIFRGRDGEFGFSVTGAEPILVCSVQPSKSVLQFHLR